MRVLPAFALLLVVFQLVQSLGPLPSKWPSNKLDVGRSRSSGASSDKQAGMRFRYQYLVGDVTGYNWKDWNSPEGDFVKIYMEDSIDNQVTPVFTYYTLVQSSPNSGDESQNSNKLQNTNLMQNWYSNLIIAFKGVGAFPNNVAVMHMEPDLWGFMQQKSSNDDATTVPVSVQSSGHPDVASFPNNAAGFAKAILHLRDTYAPNCMVSYHISIWGTSVDIITQDPSSAEAVALGNRAATWYSSFGADFDLAFGEFTDKDSGAYDSVATDGTSCLPGKAGCSHWATAQDFANVASFFGAFTSNTNKRLVLWQIPLGNTKMRTCNNVQYHFQSNHVETFFGDSRDTLQNYVDIGVIAILFGPGCEDWCTNDYDLAQDGVTNPTAINGNTRVASSSDDEGGYFQSQVAAYYGAGAISLPSAGSDPVTSAAAPNLPACSHGCFTTCQFPYSNMTDSSQFSMTVSNCLGYCTSLGFKYSGITNGDSCGCSNSYVGKPQAASNCDATCPTTGEVCGDTESLFITISSRCTVGGVAMGSTAGLRQSSSNTLTYSSVVLFLAFLVFHL